MKKEEIQKEVERRFPTEENECGEREFMRKSCIDSFEEGVKYALEQVKNNVVLDDVIKQPYCEMEGWGSRCKNICNKCKEDE